jgi:hypothetical protein
MPKRTLKPLNRLADALGRPLLALMRTFRERRWLKNNKVAFDAYNRRVLQYGLLSDEAGLQ